MTQQDNSKTDKQGEALTDLELTAKEDEEINGGIGGQIDVYMHVIRTDSSITK